PAARGGRLAPARRGPENRCSSAGSAGASGSPRFERGLRPRNKRVGVSSVRARALPAQSISGGGFGRGAKPPSEDLRDGRCANLAEPDGKERVEQRSVADERRVHALPKETLGALD